MKLNLNEIQEYLASALNISELTVFDDSHLHHTHGSYQAQKAYLRIHIPKQSQNRLSLQRQIMRLASDICNQPIHAIQIISQTVL